MANSSAENVRFVDTTATTFTGPLKICSIKYIGAAASSVTIRSGGASGAILWTESATTNVFNGDVDIKCGADIYIAITGTASVYLYLG